MYPIDLWRPVIMLILANYQPKFHTGMDSMLFILTITYIHQIEPNIVIDNLLIIVAQTQMSMVNKL